MNKPMTKREWLSYIEKTWDTAQREAWGETPRREWVALTDEEKNQVAWSCGSMSADWLEFADAIEAKLKEKNT